MRKIVRFLLRRPILWLANEFSSAPDRERIFEALTALKQRLEKDPGKKGFIIPFDITANKYILFSDQHKGRKNGADDFALAEKNYVSALNYYNSRGNVQVGEGSLIGTGAIIIPGKKVGAWSIIGAGSVVIDNIPDYVVAVGNPAKVIKRVAPPGRRV